MKWISNNYKKYFPIYCFLIYIMNLGIFYLILTSISNVLSKLGIFNLAVNLALYLIAGFIIITLLSIFSYGHRKVCLDISENLKK